MQALEREDQRACLALLGPQFWGSLHISSAIEDLMPLGSEGFLPLRRTMLSPLCRRGFPSTLMTPASFVTSPPQPPSSLPRRLLNLPRPYGPGCWVRSLCWRSALWLGTIGRDGTVKLPRHLVRRPSNRWR